MTPSPRCAHTMNMLHIGTKHFLAIYGGWDGAGIIFNDLLLFDCEEDKWVTPLFSNESNLVPRFGHASDTLQNENKLLLFGGVNSRDDLGELTKVNLTYM